MENKNMLFGLRPIIEAIEAGRQIEKVYLKKGATAYCSASWPNRAGSAGSGCSGSRSKS